MGKRGASAGGLGWCIGCLTAGFFLAASGGCNGGGGSTTSSSSSGGCTVGVSAPCACTTGQLGAQICGSAGTFGPCDCTGTGATSGTIGTNGTNGTGATGPTGVTGTTTGNPSSGATTGSNVSSPPPRDGGAHPDGSKSGQCGASTAPPGSTCPSGGLPCGDDKCCAPSSPYYCPANSSCYATAASAAAACGGSSCLTCTAEPGPDGGGQCSAAGGASGTCPSGELACGSYGCCEAATPYVCPGTSMCYATAAAASAACGGAACYACTPAAPMPDAGPQCGKTQAVAGDTCVTAGQVPCGNDVCCPSTALYYCPTTSMCYATAGEATTACGGTDCITCAAVTTSCGCLGVILQPTVPSCNAPGYTCPGYPLYCGLSEAESAACCCWPADFSYPDGQCILCNMPGQTCGTERGQCCGCT